VRRAVENLPALRARARAVTLALLSDTAADASDVAERIRIVRFGASPKIGCSDLLSPHGGSVFTGREPTAIDPESTTVDPESTTVDPESTTVDPESTTVDPESTTVDPESTTVDPESTTVDSESMTVDSESTTVDSESGEAACGEGRLSDASRSVLRPSRRFFSPVHA
jgi:hypothetical protein